MISESLSNFKSEKLVYNHIIYTEIENNFHNPQTHDFWEIIYFIQGSASYQIEGRNYYVKKNRLILTRPHMLHNLEVSENVYERYDVLFDKSLVRKELFKKIPQDINVIDLSDFPQILEIFSRADYYYEYFSNNEFEKILSNLLEEIFYNIEIFCKTADYKKFNGNYTVNSILSKAIAYIDSNISKDFQIEEICDYLFISKSYLHQLFTKHLQITPQKYTTIKKLLKAQKEIRKNGKPTQVYINCGFSDYSSFFRAYKKYFGYPPSEEKNYKVANEIII